MTWSRHHPPIDPRMRDAVAAAAVGGAPLCLLIVCICMCAIYSSVYLYISIVSMCLCVHLCVCLPILAAFAAPFDSLALQFKWLLDS